MVTKFHIKSIGIFGSYVRGENNTDSDIDILVVFKKGKETFKNYMGLKFFLEDNLHKKIDLIIESTLKPIVKDIILREVIYA